MKIIIKIIFCLSFGALTLQANAHHAFTAEFDPKAPINITGKVVKVEWINPHAWVHVEVEDEKGKIIWTLREELRILSLEMELLGKHWFQVL